MGSQIQALEHYKQGYQNTMDELAKHQSEYASNKAYYEALGIHSEQEYYDKTEELINQQYDFAESISDTEQSIVDMYESSIDAVEKYIDTLVDGYNDYIDSVKAALDAERDLYDFKKSVRKQAKDISEIERKIISLSGSQNAADVAQRRKLESELYSARESLNDTYYDHAKDAQQDALDSEAQAYEEIMTKFVEGLRTSLAEATSNMDEFLMGVTSMVMYNADTILTKYEETNLPLTKELTNPWEEAKKAVGSYSGNALDLMNQWTRDGGFFAQFNKTGTTNLTSPWSSGTNAANAFKSSVATAMSGVVSNISSNVKTASSELSKLYQQIQDTEKRAISANVSVSPSSYSGGGGTGSTSSSQPQSTPAKTDNSIFNKYGLTSDQVLALGYGPISLNKFEELLRTYKMKYAPGYKQVWNTDAFERSIKSFGKNYVSGPLAIRQYAKGTTGVTEDQLAVVDELGPELILHADPATGRLEYLTKGSGVVPSDLTSELMELGKLGVDGLMDINKFGVNVNMINNAVTKPRYNFSFDSMVHVDNCDQSTLKDLEKMVDNKINDFNKALNYSMKRFAR